MASTCRGCGRPVLWVETSTGKRMPLDPETSATGNVVLEQASSSEGPLGAFRAHVLRRGEVWPGDRYVAHFATCPKAEQFRRATARSGSRGARGEGGS